MGLHREIPRQREVATPFGYYRRTPGVSNRRPTRSHRNLRRALYTTGERRPLSISTFQNPVSGPQYAVTRSRSAVRHTARVVTTILELPTIWHSRKRLTTPTQEMLYL